jgi:hypothetical protein
MELTLLDVITVLTIVAMVWAAVKWRRRQRWSARSRMRRPLRYLTIFH